MLTSTNYNPDVLTCLANLSSDEVFTPPQLVNRILDLLPDELWSNRNATFLDPAYMANEGISARHIEYALMDFHDAINIGTTLGGDNLGDSSSIGVGSLTVGTAFDSKQLSDDKYTDLGSKRIGVKG